MSCRTTPAGSAFTSYARFANGSRLSDVATLSTFHYLRSLYQSRSEDQQRIYTDEDYRGLLRRQRDRVARLTQVSEARRNSMLARIDQALNDPSTPDQSTLYALHNLNPTIRDRGRGLQTFLMEYARTTGASFNEAQEKWTAHENSIDRSRSALPPETFTEANQARARELGLPRDPGSVHAMAMLDQEIEIHDIAVAMAAPQRIERSPISASIEGMTLLEQGYDPRSNRLEVRVRDANGNEHTWAYQNIESGDYSNASASSDSFASWWSSSIHGNAAHAYDSPREAARAGVAPRCTVCGQFANSSHACPVLPEPTHFSSYAGRWTRQDVAIPDELRTNPDGYMLQGNDFRVRLPGAMRLREAFRAGPVRVSISEWFSSYTLHPETGDRRWNNARLSGNLMAYRNEEGQIAFNVAELTCSCDAFQANNTCAHVNLTVSALRQRLIPPVRSASRSLTPEERAERAAEAQRLAEAAAASDWTRNEATLAEARRTWRSDSEVIYSDDFDSFETTYNAAVERAAAAETPQISYMRDNALGGLAVRGSGQAFGVEIEYDFPSSMGWAERNNANRQIGIELHAAGLAAEPTQQGYGASRRYGFRDTHATRSGVSTWSFERDGSVGGGELVTPAMYDEPETWEKLEKAVEILTRNGAVTSRKAGAHIHVGTASYQGDGAKYTELARLMTQHEDVMLRIAADPNRGTHRNTAYTAPLSDVPVSGFADVSAAKRWQSSRTKALNLMSVQNTGSDHTGDHVEFRIFDSSLNAGAIQAQIRTAVAMTSAAARIAGEGPTSRGKEIAGSHADRAKARGRRRLTSDDLKDDTATFRSLLDTLFTRKADKDQLIELFAQTKWVKKTARR